MTEKELDKALADIKMYVAKYPTGNDKIYLEGATHAISAIKISLLSEKGSESSIVVGDTVLIVGPKEPEEELIRPIQIPFAPMKSVCWVNSMNPLIGKEFTVFRIDDAGTLQLTGEPWTFHPNWVQKVEAKSFKIGDKVRVSKPKNTDESPSWVDDMDKFHRQVLTIRRFYTSQCIQVEETGWNFNPKWLTKLPDFKEGDRVVIQKPGKDECKKSFVGWVDPMDIFDGAIVILPEILDMGTFEYHGWRFDLLWCKKAGK